MPPGILELKASLEVRGKSYAVETVRTYNPMMGQGLGFRV